MCHKSIMRFFFSNQICSYESQGDVWDSSKKKKHKLSILCIITDTMFSTLNCKLNKELKFGMRVQVEQLCFNIEDNGHLCSLNSIMNQKKQNSNNM